MLSIKLRAYAKINLGLRILKKRDDGYHDIETVFHRVNPYDEIILRSSSKISFESDSPHLLTDDNNLCVKAAKLLQRWSGKENGVHILLKKNIPIGAGLGGGSSDATSTLIGLVKLWNINIKKEELSKLALQLGSDVPYFLDDLTAYATGRGEVLEYFKLEIPYWIVLVYPNIHIKTKWAYESLYDPRFAKHEQTIDKQISGITLKQILLQNIHDPSKLNHLVRNDFEPIVLHEHKIVSHVKESIYSAGAKFAQMSGSGSAVYGFFNSKKDTANAAAILKKNYQVFVTPPDFNVDMDA